MKKLFSIILIACLAMAVMAVAPVSAANDEVLYGTPTIDGVVDEIYKQSVTIEYVNEADNVVEHPWFSATGTFYALYDSSYVYLCADVKDDDVVSAADSFVYENNNPYKNDVVEFRLDFNGGDAMFKIGVDAYGKRAYTIQPDLCDIEQVEYACTQSEDGYVIEVKVPYDTNDRNDVYSAGKLGIKVWLFDLHADYEGMEAPQDKVHFSHFAVDGGEGSGTPVLYNLSEEKAVAPSAGNDDAGKTDDDAGKTDDDAGKTDDDAGKTDDDAGKTDDTTSTPTTFDPALIAVVLTAASGAAFVVASKKRH